MSPSRPDLGPGGPPSSHDHEGDEDDDLLRVVHLTESNLPSPDALIAGEEAEIAPAMVMPTTEEPRPEGAPDASRGAAGASPAKIGRVLSIRSMLSYRDDNSAAVQNDHGVPKRTAEVEERLERKVEELGGSRPIHSVLVANNGLAAVKFIRSIQSWAYSTLGSERAVQLIAMATPEDMRAEAEHVRMADQFVEVPGGKNVNNYANVALIASLAARTRVDAVWPGWGHASEDPELPAALAETPKRAEFLGPPGAAMAALGDKVGSTILAQAAGVPTLPWSGSGIKVAYADCPNGAVPPEPYEAACVHSLQEALQCCQRIGYPVMLKASWGGGGKGIRRVASDDEVRRVYGQVLAEVPGSPVFAMKLAPKSRHLEVQLLCDKHGNVASIFSRDCSVQRRHQKIVEEGPVTCAPPHVLRDMERCARALAREVGYVGAATVEYLYLVETGEYCFLELNPRLQVEHPVTEWISGVNIPAAQLLIGAGVPLHRIPDMRRLFRRDPDGDSPIDFEDVESRAPPAGHVVAVRITAENANDGFKPTSGTIDELSFRSTPDVWGYFSVKSGGAVHEFSDSQFGHLFARGETRGQAIRAMVVALKEIRIRGEIRTTVDYVLDMIQSADFLANTHHTAWLDARIAAQVRSERPSWYLAVASGAVLKALDRIHSLSAEWLASVARGAPPPKDGSLVRTKEEFVVDDVKYLAEVSRHGASRFRVTLLDPETGKPGVAARPRAAGAAGAAAAAVAGLAISKPASPPEVPYVDVVARSLKDGGVLLQIDGASHVVHREEEALGTRLTIDLQTCLLSNEHDPSRLIAASTGKLVRALVPDGGRVAADEPYAEVEVMKMVMTLPAPAAGTVRWAVAEGSPLASGMLIARLDLDDPDSVKRAEPYKGGFPPLGPPRPAPDGVGQRYAAARQDASDLLAGYDADPDAVMEELMRCLDDPTLPLAAWDEVYASASSRLPPKVASELEAVVSKGVSDGVEAVRAIVEAEHAARARKAAAADPDAPLPGEEDDVHASSAARPAASTSSDGSTPPASRAPFSFTGPQLPHAGGLPPRVRDVAASLSTPTPGTPEHEAAVRAANDTSARLRDYIRRKLGEAAELPTSERAELTSLLQPLLEVASTFSAGRPAATRELAQRILSEFLAVEEAYQAAQGGGVDVLDALRAKHSPSGLSAVLDLVVARRAIESRARFVEEAIRRLVAPSPDAHRPTLRRLAALTTSGTQGVAAAAQRTLERSLLGELRGLVARALLGLDMFDDRMLRGFADGEDRGAALISAAALGGAGAALSPPASPQGGRRQTARRTTLAEGLYAGLGNLRDPRATVESRMAMLVGAPAAVDDALASLLDSSDGLVARRALLTYVRRLYAPGLLRDPQVLALDAAGETVPGAIWLHERVAPCARDARVRHGAAVLLGPGVSLAAVARALAGARQDVAARSGGTLHVVLTGPPPPPPQLAAGARAPESDDPDALEAELAARAAAAMREGGSAVLEAGYDAVCFLLQRGTAPPARLALYSHAQAGALAFPATAVGAGASAAPAPAHRRTGSTLGGRPPLRSLPSVSLTRLGDVEVPSEWALDVALARVEPPTAEVLELSRLRGSHLISAQSSRNRQWLVVTTGERRDARSPELRRAFLRGTVRALGRPALLAATYSGDPAGAAAAAVEEVASTLAAAVEELARAAQAARAAGNGLAPDWASVFLSVLHPLPLGGPADEQAVADALRGAAAAVAARGAATARAAALASWELRLRCAGSEGRAWRVVHDAPTGHEVGEECVEVYVEEPGASPEDPPRRRAVPAPLRAPGPLDGRSPLEREPPLAPLQQRRLAARRHDTTYAYDFPAVFEAALRAAWAAAADDGSAAPARRGGSFGGSTSSGRSSLPAGRLVAARELVPEFGPFADERALGGELSQSSLDGATGAGSALASRSAVPEVRLTLREREPGRNDVGVVAWVLTLKTPEAPAGRQVVAIANDITFSSGAFGPREDAVFAAASRYALDARLPIVYLAVNSGARVGLAAELKQMLHVKWLDPAEPARGFDYLYLSDDEYLSLLRRVAADHGEDASGVRASTPAAWEGRIETTRFARTRVRVLPQAGAGAGAVVHELLDAFGLEDGLGVECLSGSGCIAGIYSRAFREGITITFASGRAVGIGAYLARLGRRVVQRQSAPLVLTGYAALNKLLGREVYSSQAQLGGPRIMGQNGVSHQVVADDLEGAAAVLKWLAFVPAHVGGLPPSVVSSDPISRSVAYSPASGEKMDARAAIAGRYVSSEPPASPDGPAGAGAAAGAAGDAAPLPSPSAPGATPSSSAAELQWQGGIFDRGSWVESQAGWARTVVAGRARLGGLPVGVIATESLTVTLAVPADPGQPDSTERMVQQAGQVWYPDSAAKTAQAMEEFDLEGLPLVVLANWRGFSGGQRDLYEGVLQAGSTIVEALRAYRHPVLVYLGPGCELRGGAWVVLDTQINPDQIEMYADPAAQGAVLEPEGVVEIKFRKPDVLRLMGRLDPELAALRGKTGPEARRLAEDRERALLPAYSKVALEFARMHDGAARMRAKGVVRGVVPWARARSFLATRLRRRLAEAALARHVNAADERVGRAQALRMLRSWYLDSPQQPRAAEASEADLLAQEGGADDASRDEIELTEEDVSARPSASPADDLVRESRALSKEDERFLAWVEGDGAARVALELRALRLASAARAVGELAASQEGAEGLVRGLAASMRENPALREQIVALLNDRE